RARGSGRSLGRGIEQTGRAIQAPPNQSRASGEEYAPRRTLRNARTAALVRRTRFLGNAGPQENFAARAKLEHFAVCAIRFARVTPAPPMPDEPVAPVRPMFSRHQLHQVLLDFFGVFLFR